MKVKIPINKWSSFLSLLISSATIPVIAVKCSSEGNVVVINNYTGPNRNKSIVKNIQNTEKSEERSVRSISTNNLLNAEGKVILPRRSVDQSNTLPQRKEKKSKTGSSLRTKRSATSKSLKCSKNCKNNRKIASSKVKKGKHKQTISKSGGEIIGGVGKVKGNTNRGVK